MFLQGKQRKTLNKEERRKVMKILHQVLEIAKDLLEIIIFVLTVWKLTKKDNK